MQAGGKDAAERGLHAFVLLSLIFAASVLKIAEAWTEQFKLPRLLPSLLAPRVILLTAVSALIVQYWWTLFDMRAAYGERFSRFVKALLQAAMFCKNT